VSLDLLDLPVWTIPPNWKDGVLERLEWLSDVMIARNGAEQRRALRLSPRRSFEVTVNPVKGARTFTELYLHRMVSFELLFPLWHDAAALDADASDGSSALSFDNTFREHEPGQCALLFKDAFTWEAVHVESMADDGLTLTNPLAYAWPTGTKVFPLRPARLAAESNFTALTSRVGQAQLLFSLTRQNDYVAETVFDEVFDGRPVFPIDLDRGDGVDLTFQRLLTEFDNATGSRYVRDIPGRSFTTQAVRWQAKGREEHHKTRALLYYLQGRVKTVWLPTYNEDVEVAVAAVSTDNTIDIRKIGYAYTGGALSGRKLLRFDEGFFAQVDGVAPAPDPQNETLALADPLGADLLVGATGSFVDVARLDQDVIEIQHHTDTNGVCEVSLALRSFADSRDPSGAIENPVPSAEMGTEPCGEDGEWSPTFEGWYFAMKMVYNDTGDPEVGYPPYHGFWRFYWEHGVEDDMTAVIQDDPPGQDPNMEDVRIFSDVEIADMPARGAEIRFFESHGIVPLEWSRFITLYYKHWTDREWLTVALDDTYGGDTDRITLPNIIRYDGVFDHGYRFFT
jgi:hypothetical protein